MGYLFKINQKIIEMVHKLEKWQNKIEKWQNKLAKWQNNLEKQKKWQKLEHFVRNTINCLILV